MPTMPDSFRRESIMNTWLKAPQQFNLLPHEVQVWSVGLDALFAEVDQLAECLSTEEIQQSQRFVNSQLTNSYIVSHAMLRHIVARYLPLKPHQIKMANTTHGKPYLIDLPAELKLEFNMSHTRDLALYAVSLHPVGIDVEACNRDIQVEEIAERFFTATEYQALRALPESARQEAFYQCWTLKEAFIKAVGEGLSYGLDKFEVDFIEMSGNCLKHIEASTSKTEAWSLRPIHYSADYKVAVAIEGKLESIKFYSPDLLDFIK